MATSAHSGPEARPHATPQDAKSALLRRIHASQALQRSARLRELLDYLIARAEAGPGCEIRECEIGEAVFHRDASYDTSHDTIVRVQVAQLRKRLEQYFATEGAAEPVVLEIPKGAYSPRFRERGPAAAPAPAPAPRPRNPWRTAALALGCCSLILTAALVLVLARNAERARPVDAAGRPAPSIAALWSRLQHPDQPTHIVLADSTLVWLQVATGRPVSLNEYARREYAAWASVPERPDLHEFLRRFANSGMVSLADVDLVRRVALMQPANARRFPVVYARDFTMRALNSGNAVLLGGYWSTPWAGAFTEKLNFVVDHDGDFRSLLVRNRHPQTGERELYRDVDPGPGQPREAYAVVALLPNRGGTGNVLLLSGWDVQSSEAAIRFVTSEELFAPFLRAVASGPSGPVPYFEALLRTRKLSGAPLEVETVAWRRKS